MTDLTRFQIFWVLYVPLSIMIGVVAARVSKNAFTGMSMVIMWPFSLIIAALYLPFHFAASWGDKK